MSKQQQKDRADALLEILRELDTDKGYDLLLIGEHAGIGDSDRLLQAARDLQEQGYIDLLETDINGAPSRPIAVPLAKTGANSPPSFLQNPPQHCQPFAKAPQYSSLRHSCYIVSSSFGLL